MAPFPSLSHDGLDNNDIIGFKAVRHLGIVRALRFARAALSAISLAVFNPYSAVRSVLTSNLRKPRGRKPLITCALMPPKQAPTQCLDALRRQ